MRACVYIVCIGLCVHTSGSMVICVVLDSMFAFLAGAFVPLVDSCHE